MFVVFSVQIPIIIIFGFLSVSVTQASVKGLEKGTRPYDAPGRSDQRVEMRSENGQVYPAQRYLDHNHPARGYSYRAYPNRRYPDRTYSDSPDWRYTDIFTHRYSYGYTPYYQVSPSCSISDLRPSIDLVKFEIFRPIPNSQALSTQSITKECSIGFYLGLVSAVNSDTIKNRIWAAVENHEINTNAVAEGLKNSGNADGKKVSNLELRHKACSFECNSLNLNSIYESLLAKNTLASISLQGKYLDIYKKIFRARAADPNYNVPDSLEKYAAKDGRYHPWPFAYYKAHGDKTKSDEIFLHSSLAFDYLVVSSYGPHRFGINPALRPYNDDLYSNFIHQERGRVDCYYPSQLKSQFGFAKVEVDVLHAGDRPAWERYSDGCIPPDSPDTLYDAWVAEKQIPWVGDISGSTTLALVTLFSSKVELSPGEMRLYLLSIFSTMASNGDHNLQEILSAAKLVSNYVSQKNYDTQLQPLIKDMPEINRNTLQSLDQVTRDIDPTGESSEKFGRYNDFLSSLQDKDLDDAVSKSRDELLGYFNQRCNQIVD